MAAQIKAGKKREDFAIGERMAKLKKSSREKTRGKRKASTSSRKNPPKSPPVSAEAGS